MWQCDILVHTLFLSIKAANLKRKLNDPRMHGLLDQSTVLEEGEGWAGLVTYKLNWKQTNNFERDQRGSILEHNAVLEERGEAGVVS